MKLVLVKRDYYTYDRLSNGCARPALAEIAFIGKAPGKYNMYLGKL